MLDKIKAFAAKCRRSATMWFAVALPVAVSWGFTNFDTISAVALDPALSDQIKTALGADPKALALVLRVMAGIAFVSRARSLIKAA